MKYFRYFFSIFIAAIPVMANAHIINDVRMINSVFHANESVYEVFKLADYGFVEGRDRITSNPLITIELRDTEYRPDKEYWEQPFVMIALSLGRHHARVGIDDWVEHWSFDEDGLLPVSIAIVDPPAVWIGNITLNFAFSPGPVVVSEGSSFILMLIGLAALGLGRQRYHATNKVA